MDYQSIEFLVGLRYYIFINQRLKLCLNGMFILMYNPVFNSKIAHLDVVPRNSYALGGGIGYKKLSAEMRYYTDRELLYDYISINMDYRRFSLIFGYKIF